uniref:UDP-glucuronosyltransferase n=2 Tax=Arion vulgaris TaxID=1028688 RepID=A0A0B7BK20_9EUPU
MTSVPCFLVLAIFIANMQELETKVVVLFSLPHTANVRTHTNVGRALAAIGHQPYVAIPQFMLDGKLVNTDGVNVIAYGDYLGNYGDKLTSNMLEHFWRGEYHHLSVMLEIEKIVQHSVRQILSDQHLIEQLNALKPDLFVLTLVPPFKNIVILPYILNTSFVWMSPFNDLHGFRVPVSPTSTPCQLAGVASYQFFLDRLKLASCNIILMVVGQISGNDSMIAEFAPHRPQTSVNALTLKAEVYLVEGDYILDFAKPELPNMKMIGCTAPGSGKPLKDPFKKFVDESKNGVAVVTFGSGIVNIPVKVAEMMAAAFEQQSLNVVWRVNYTSQNAGKIITSRWIPQNDILAHPNTRLFVSHCGANGQYEALYHGVPMICMPISGDQYYNAQRSTAKGFGLDASLLELTSTQLADLMKEVTENAKYRNNIKKASTLFRQLYKESDKTAAFWIDHVMEYGGSYMRSAGQDMPLYQFYALDVLGLILLLIIAFVFVIYYTCRCCCGVFRKFCRKQPPSKKNKRE